MEQQQKWHQFHSRKEEGWQRSRDPPDQASRTKVYRSGGEIRAKTKPGMQSERKIRSGDVFFELGTNSKRKAQFCDVLKGVVSSTTDFEPQAAPEAGDIYCCTEVEDVKAAIEKEVSISAEEVRDCLDLDVLLSATLYNRCLLRSPVYHNLLAVRVLDETGTAEDLEEATMALLRRACEASMPKKSQIYGDNVFNSARWTNISGCWDDESRGNWKKKLIGNITEEVGFSLTHFLLGHSHFGWGNGSSPLVILEIHLRMTWYIPSLDAGAGQKRADNAVQEDLQQQTII
ncbi:hypothetical protein J6590_074769 [Homalodisca vitripennis]|nr:hypothetical protein J6590_074769 [Homalodisca vitripennis]